MGEMGEEQLLTMVQCPEKAETKPIARFIVGTCYGAELTWIRSVISDVPAREE